MGKRLTPSSFESTISNSGVKVTESLTGIAVRSQQKKMQNYLRENQPKAFEEYRHTLVAFSMFCFILVAIFSNEQILKGQRPTYTVSDMGINQQFRGIASIEGIDSKPSQAIQEIEWEKKLAKKLEQASEGLRKPASVGRKPQTLEESFRWQYADKYLIHANTEAPKKILSISFVESESGEAPIHVRHLVDDEDILEKYKRIFPVNYSEVGPVTQKDQTEVHELLDSNGRVVGKAIFELDDQNRVLAFYFHQ